MKVPRGYWKDITNQRAHVDNVAKSFGLKHLDDWYNITFERLSDSGIRGLLNNYYNNSTMEMLTALYPQHTWLQWRFGRTSKGFWDNHKNRIAFVEWLGNDLGVKKLDDWYRITTNQVTEKGGSGLLQVCYNSSLVKMLRSIYPDHPWTPWKFVSVPRGFWEEFENRKTFVEWAGQQLGVKKLDDWYRVSVQQFIELGGYTFISTHHNNSLAALLEQMYPQHVWQGWKFKSAPHQFWYDVGNQKTFIEWVGSHFGITKLDDWYNISTPQIFEACGGGGLLGNHYKGSLARALNNIFPQHKWEWWKFKYPPKKWYNEPQQLMLYVQSLVESFGLQSSWKKMVSKGIHNSIVLSSVMTNLMPSWDHKNVENTKFRSNPQSHIKNILTELKVGDIMENYKHPQIRHFTGISMELDLFLPKHNVAFEYQGEHHNKLPFMEQTRSTEVDKKKACDSAGILLVEIPCSWDGTKESLMRLLKHKCSFLMPKLGSKSTPLGGAIIRKTNLWYPNDDMPTSHSLLSCA